MGGLGDGVVRSIGAWGKSTAEARDDLAGVVTSTGEPGVESGKSRIISSTAESE